MELKYNNVLVPYDFSEHSNNSLKYAIKFCEHFNSKIFLIYVIEPPLYPADFSMGQIAIPSIDIEFESKIKDELEKLASNEIGNKLQYEIIVKTGKPFIEIIETASQINADLIIIATHGKSGMEQILFGSTAEKVVRKAHCPVLTLRNPIKGFNYLNKM